MVGITQLQSAALMGSPLIAQQEQTKRLRAMAQALRDASMQQEGTQFVSGRAIPYQPMQGVAKLIQALGGGLTDYMATQREQDLGQQMRASRAAAIQGGDVNAMLASDDPMLQMHALSLAERQAKAAEPSQSRQDMLWAAGGDEEKARQLYIDSKQDPFKALSFQLQAMNSQNNEAARQRDDARAEREFQFRQKEAAVDNARAERNIGLLEEDRNDRRAEREADRRRKLAERAYNIELAQWEKENPTYRQDETKLKDAEVNKKKLDDAADDLISKLSATKGDNIPNFQVGPLNADRARELQNSYQALLWNIRSPEMANTGVLNPGEIPMLEQAIADPTSLRNVGQTEAIIKQIEELKKTASRNYGTMRDVFGKRAPPPKFDPNAEVDLPESYLSDMEKSLGTSPKSAPVTAKPSVDDLLKKYGRK